MSAPGNFVNTFVAPRPKPWLIAALAPLNRVLCLGGVPGLRSLPWLGRIPGLRGLADVVGIDLPAADRARLAHAVNDATAAFIAPNHPEFFTDWMLDKEICSRFAPLTANWATHSVVNGMGRTMQRFWLANNLIAQIPGSGGTDGKIYSAQWAAQGHAVLLHPEGQVGWHNDYVGPLFGGVVDMALDTIVRLRQMRSQRPVFIAPVVWKLRFVDDERRRLAREMTRVERVLTLRNDPSVDLAERVYRAYSDLLVRDAQTWGISVSANDEYWLSQARVLAALAQRLRSMSELSSLSAMAPRSGQTETPADAQALTAHYVNLASAAERALRGQEDTHAVREARRLARDMRRILRLRPEMLPAPTMSQEQVAENIKRLRNDYCFGGLRDNINRVLPRPAGSRVAHVRVPESIDISALAPEGSMSEEAQAVLLGDVRARMQRALDEVNAVLGESRVVFANPFA